MSYGRFNIYHVTLAIGMAVAVSPLLFANDTIQQRLPTVAILDDGETAIVPLVEAKLLAGNSATWVERSQVEQVLKEQKLQAAFSGDAVKQRSQLGKLLKCDLLVLVRTTRGLPGETLPENGAKPPEVIECVVCETKHGLRLHTAYVPKLRPAEVNVNELADLISQGLTRWRNRIVQVFAVPPLVSDDLDFRRNYLQTAYASLIQQQLLEIPGTVVVELAEAQAIAREFAVVGEEGKVDRNLSPFYIQGRYRHDDTAGQATVKFNLRMEHEGRELRSGDSLPLASESAPEWLQRAVAALVKTAGRSEPVKRDAQREASALAKRAEEFMQIGQWEEALALLEASLLLKPEATEVRKSAVICCGKVRDYYFHKRVPLHEMLPPLKQSMAVYRRGMEHLEIYIAGTSAIPVYNPQGISFVTNFDSPFWASIRISHNAPEEAHELIREMQALRTENYLRIGLSRAKAKQADKFWFGWILFGTPLKDRLVVIRRILEHVEEVPLLVDVLAQELQGIDRDFGSKDPNVQDRIRQIPELVPLIDQLEKSTSPQQRAIVTETRRIIDEMSRSRLNFKHQSANRIDLNAEFQLNPITFRTSDDQPLRDMPVRGVSAGSNADVFLGRNTIYLMKKPKILQPIWTESAALSNVGVAVFDGRYVWCVVNQYSKDPRLLIIDPESESVKEFQSTTPFPAAEAVDTSLNMNLAPLAPGRVLITAFMGRTWIGVAEGNSSGEGKLKIVYEARGVEVAEKQAKQPPTVAFIPIGMYPRQKTGGGIEVFITRMSVRNLYFNYESGLVFSDADDSVKPTDDKFNFNTARGITSHADQIQYLEFDAVQRPEQYVFHLIGVDDEKISPRILVSDVPWGRMFWHANNLHIVGEKWWIWNPKTSQFRELQGEIPWLTWNAPSRFKAANRVIRKSSPYDTYLENTFSSQLLGLVLFTNQRQVFATSIPTFSN